MDEAGEPVDIHGDAVALPGEGEVGLVHPAQLDAELSDRWHQLLADSGTLPPFEQLSREVYTVDEVAALFGELAGYEVPSGWLRSLRDIGWTRGPTEDAGLVHELHKEVGSTTLVLRFDPGLDIVGGDTSETQTLQAPDGRALGRMSAVEVSEVGRDLKRM